MCHVQVWYYYNFERQVIGNGHYKDVRAFHRLYLSLCDFILFGFLLGSGVHGSGWTAPATDEAESLIRFSLQIFVPELIRRARLVPLTRSLSLNSYEELGWYSPWVTSHQIFVPELIRRARLVPLTRSLSLNSNKELGWYHSPDLCLWTHTKS